MFRKTAWIIRIPYIREKYNAVNRTTVADVSAGYADNVVGFGWTNGTFLVLLHELSAPERLSTSRRCANRIQITGVSGVAETRRGK